MIKAKQKKFYSEIEFLQTVCTRGRSRTAATSKMERFVIIVNGFQCSILDVAAVLDPSLSTSDLKLECTKLFLLTGPK